MPAALWARPEHLYLAFCRVLAATLPAISAVVMTMSELEQIEQIADGRAVLRHIRIVLVRMGVREVVSAPRSQGLKVPVALDELQDRDVVGVCVADVAALGEGRNHDHRDARPIAEEVERLDVAGVIEAAALVHR